MRCSLPSCRVNVPPVANADTATTAANVAVVIDVVANDTDATGTIVASSVAVGTLPGHGSALANGNGTVTYTPTAGYVGSDSFTYTVRDTFGATSNSATVTITVTTPATRQFALSATRFNAVVGDTSLRQGTQVLSPLSQQQITSGRYRATVALF